MPLWTVSLASPRVQARATYSVEAVTEAEALKEALRAVRSGEVTGWIVISRSVGGSWAGTPSKAWATPTGDGLWEVSILSAFAAPGAVVRSVFSPNADRALADTLLESEAGRVRWFWEGLALGGSPPDPSGWVSLEPRPTSSDLVPPGTPIVPRTPFLVPCTVVPAFPPPEAVQGGVITVFARTGRLDLSPVAIGSGLVAGGVSLISCTLPLSWGSATVELSASFSGSEGWEPSQGPWHAVPVNAQRWIWIAAGGFGLWNVNCDASVATQAASYRFFPVRSVTSVYDTPSTERIYASLEQGFGGPGFIPYFDAVSLAETDLFGSYDGQLFIRALGDTRLWSARDTGTVGSVQELDLAGNILNEVDLSFVPSAPVAHRVPYSLAVVGTSVHVLEEDSTTSEPKFVEIDSVGAATVRESTGVSMQSSQDVVQDSGQIAVCSGSLWIGDAGFPGPPPTDSAVFTTNLATYVTSRVPLSVDVGVWTRTMTTDGAKLYAGFRDTMFQFRVVRIATDGTIEASWFDPIVQDLTCAIFDVGKLWVVAGFPARVGNDYYLVKIDPITMMEESRIFLYLVLFALGTVGRDAVAVGHGPP